VPISAPEAELLEVRGLVAGYGKIVVLHGVDLTVRPGEVVVRDGFIFADVLLADQDGPLQ
jgi:hypothetical protein